ncbi:DNA-binding NarL/FixJ family response regulator [Catenulispora sp. MAP12-49]|uniref:response regulator n=1 Tax=Catenulispora sp. MAP12-49 TaxID=3156302 RepID=UPI0035171AF1
MAVRVLLVDDQPLARAALRMVIDSAPDLELAGEAGTGAEAVRLARETAPDVVMMDIRMPGMDGIEATRRITAAALGARVLILTTFDEDEHVYAALRAGASGFLVKDMALPDILAAVRVVAAGEALIAPSVTRRLIEDFARRPEPAQAAATPGTQSTSDTPGTPGTPILARLSEREREVLTLVAEGLSNAEIGERLYISSTTVKTHVTRMLAKLDARDRVHLVILAYRAGLARL